MSNLLEMQKTRGKINGHMTAIKERAKSGARELTEAEKSLIDQGELTVSVLDTKIQDEKRALGARLSGDTEAGIEGRANETLTGKQTFRGWYNQAIENDVHITVGDKRSGYNTVSLRSQGTDRDINRYWGERFQLAKPTTETRALLEDTAGSAQAITPQQWVADYVDVLLPNTIMGNVGAVTVPMATEMTNVPVFTSTVSPQWIAEAGSISLDANPAFAPLQLNSTGGFKDITLFSIEAAQDAFISGDLPGMLAQAVSAKMAVVLDTAMILGVSSNPGIPGLNGESGFNIRHYTGDSGTTGATVADTTELSVVAELIRNKNAEPSAIVSNPSVHGTYSRLTGTGGTYPMFWPRPADVADLPWVYSANSALPATETDPATASSVAQTGGTFSSLYMGPWNRFCVLGIHLDMQTRVLNERYIDSGQIGLFSFCRFSIRFAHPETFYRTIGLKTT